MEEKPKEEKIELSERQRTLYNLLMSQPDHWFTQREICDVISGYNYVIDPKATNDHCSTIGEDKRAINECPEAEKIVVMKNYCFKIATESEYKEERLSHINRIKSQVAQVVATDKKYYRNGTADLWDVVLNELKPDDIHFHESFFEPPTEINGEKVYTRVLINWPEKIAYIVTAKKIQICWNGFTPYALVITAVGTQEIIRGIKDTTYSLETFNSNSVYKDFEKRYIR